MQICINGVDIPQSTYRERVIIQSNISIDMHYRNHIKDFLHYMHCIYASKATSAV